jgi:hypothetical protein
MAEYSSHSHRYKSKGLSELNEFVVLLRKYAKDMTTVRDKVSELLDGSKLRMSANTRAAGVKLQQNLQNHCDTLARAISDISK